MARSILLCVAAVLIVSSSSGAEPNSIKKVQLTPCIKDANAASRAYESPLRWKADIAKFDKSDANSFPPKNAILFVGSSSIRMWNVKRSFPDLITINRGFGGSFISDSTYYADKIIFPYEPNTIVFYAGDNDVASGMPPEKLLADFMALEKVIHKELPDTKLICISVKPSISRWQFWSCMNEANQLIASYCSKTHNCKFLDVSAAMLNEQGMPRAELFGPDGLHMNNKGYDVWAELLRPLLK